MIGLAQELLSTDGGAELAKLRQRREALTTKAELLRKLDEEIVEAVHEDELEAEIENADMFREWIELAILELDGAMRVDADKSRVTESERPAARARAIGDPLHDVVEHRESRDVSPDEDAPSDALSHDYREHGDSPHVTSDGPSTRGAPGDPPAIPLPSVTGGSPTDRLYHSPHVKLPKLVILPDGQHSGTHSNQQFTRIQR